MPKYNFKFAGDHYDKIVSEDGKTTVEWKGNDLIIATYGSSTITLGIATGGGENYIAPPRGFNKVDLLTQALKLFLGEDTHWTFIMPVIAPTTAATPCATLAPYPAFESDVNDTNTYEDSIGIIGGLAFGSHFY